MRQMAASITNATPMHVQTTCALLLPLLHWHRAPGIGGGSGWEAGST
jgi:hypothetical protein